ncbi:M56 family metallopeptidase [Alteriqipengyuania sp. 357]
MSIDWQTFALETLGWTAALVALVLVLRRPVARYFGAEAAYALWALPFLRLLFPPLVLPAWFATEPAPAPAAQLPLVQYPLADMGTGPVMLQPMVVGTPEIDWLMLALVGWLVGSVAFLVRRYTRYFTMRGELLAESTPVGTRGKVRLVETEATRSPVAFGVFDKVIALPAGFMMQTEPTRRDLALAHELEHHRAHDLLVNALVQPLFAMHWFNPLGWVGWRALRRDQEAACDARVVANCDRALRPTYASTIAAFATAGRGPSIALAAPMACPVLGDKSIIHRLRSLTMSDVSPRRRLAARTLIIGALAALPLTATVSYAERMAAAEPPAPPEAPEAPALGVPDAPPAPDAPDAPLPPEAPEPGEVSETTRHVIVMSDEDDRDGGEAKRVVRVERSVTTDAAGKPTERTSYTVNGREATAEERARIEKQIADLPARTKADRRKIRVLQSRLGEGGEALRDMDILGERLGENGEFQRKMEKLQREMRARAENSETLRLSFAEIAADLPEFRFECDGSGEMMREKVEANGETVTLFCQGAHLSSAKMAIASARRAVEADRDLSRRERSKALRALDEAMKEIDEAS